MYLHIYNILLYIHMHNLREYYYLKLLKSNIPTINIMLLNILCMYVYVLAELFFN